jgi:hypothetical protein
MLEKVISEAASRQPGITQSAEVWSGSATATPQLDIIATIRAMAPSTGNRVGIISLSPIRGRITRAGKVFLLKFFWLKGEGTKKKSRQPSTLYVVFLTKVAPGRLGARRKSERETRKPRYANPSAPKRGRRQMKPILHWKKSKAEAPTLPGLARKKVD